MSTLKIDTLEGLTSGKSETVDALIEDRLISQTANDVAGTAALLDTGTAAGELPTNADLGSASLVDTGTAAGEIPLSPATTTITASATFTNSTNNIALVGLGSIGLEIGDVIEVTGTDDNDKLFTVEVITDADNVIVNQAHAGGTTIKSLVDETISATVTLVAKWFNAPIGLGQGYCAPSRSENVTYTNPTGRSIYLSIKSTANSNSLSTTSLVVDGLYIKRERQDNTGWEHTSQGIIPKDSTYLLSESNIDGTIWHELR